MQAGTIEAALRFVADNPSWAAIAVLAVLLYMTIMNPVKVMLFHAYLSGLVEKLSTRAARHSVAADIQGRVVEYVGENHAESILPYRLKFKWVRDGVVESYMDKGDVIVVMDYQKNNDRNFVNAIRGYTAQAFLPDIRHDLPQKIMLAAELVIQENIIRSKRKGALTIFLNEVVPSQIGGDVEVKAYYESLAKLDLLGFFDNIFLNEIVLRGEALRGLEPGERDAELQGLVAFLEKFWERKTSEEIPLAHKGRIFKVGIVLVAKAEKIVSGTDAYVWRVKDILAKGIMSAYVTGIKYEYDFVDQVIKAVREELPEKLVWVRTYRSQRRLKDARDAVIAFLQY